MPNARKHQSSPSAGPKSSRNPGFRSKFARGAQSPSQVAMGSQIKGKEIRNGRPLKQNVLCHSEVALQITRGAGRLLPSKGSSRGLGT